MTQAELVTVIMVKLIEAGRVPKSFVDVYSVKSCKERNIPTIEFNDSLIVGIKLQDGVSI